MNTEEFKQKFQIIEIIIPKAGNSVNISTTTETDHEKVTGVAIYKNGGNHGHGTIALKIDGDEILPTGFHVDIITLDSADKNLVLKDVLWPVDKEAKGSQVQIEYREPEDGDSGTIWLYLLTTKLKD